MSRKSRDFMSSKLDGCRYGTCMHKSAPARPASPQPMTTPIAFDLMEIEAHPLAAKFLHPYRDPRPPVGRGHEVPNQHHDQHRQGEYECQSGNLRDSRVIPVRHLEVDRP